MLCCAVLPLNVFVSFRFLFFVVVSPPKILTSPYLGGQCESLRVRRLLPGIRVAGGAFVVIFHVLPLVTFFVFLLSLAYASLP